MKRIKYLQIFYLRKAVSLILYVPLFFKGRTIFIDEYTCIWMKRLSPIYEMRQLHYVLNSPTTELTKINVKKRLDFLLIKKRNRINYHKYFLNGNSF